MNADPPITDELWQQIPPAAQAAIRALIESYERRLADLEARLQQNSTNSSKPPSSDPPSLKRSHPKPPLFAFVDGVGPTNNAAERALRHGVLWRKMSHGPKSVKGSEYLGCIWSVVETCRQQGRDVWDFLTVCMTAATNRCMMPSLLPLPTNVYAA